MVRDSKIVELMLQRRGRITVARAQEIYTEVLGRPDASPRQKAIAAIRLGNLHQQFHDDMGAIREWSRVDGWGPVPFYLSCIAWNSRASLRYVRGDALGAICDYTAVITHSSLLETHQEAAVDAKVHVPPEFSPLQMMGSALVERARARGFVGDFEGAVADVAWSRNLVGLAAELILRGWIRLVEVHLWAGNYPQVVEAVEQAVNLSPRHRQLRVAGGIALAALGRFPEALYACEQGLPWILTLARLDKFEAWLEAAVKVYCEEFREVRDRFRWRRQELEAYEPIRDGDPEL